MNRDLLRATMITWTLATAALGAGIAGCRPAVCGDGVCDLTEGCGSCSRDCGLCGTGTRAPYMECASTSGCMNARDLCRYVDNRGISRGMCTVSPCSIDDECDLDRWGVRGDCLSFGAGYDCYQRCTVSADCETGFGCYTPVGAIDAAGTICLPE